MSENKDCTEPKAISPASAPRNASAELSLEDLRRYVRLKYGTERKFSRSMGWGRALGSRLLNGSWIPQKPEIIARIAAELAIDPVVLTQLFERLRCRPHFITADKFDSLQSDTEKKS